MVIIGGSAGSLEVLLTLLPGLAPDISYPIVIVLHRKPNNPAVLTQLLAVRTGLPVCEIEEKQPILGGCIYIAPVDYHVLFEKDFTFSLDYSEPVNYSRPSIDVAFESAAQVYGEGLVALLLSGANADGVAGLRAVINFGGTAVIQDPETAAVAYMPAQAQQSVPISAKLQIYEMAKYLNALSTEKH